jgi:hypothetical protein
LEGKQRFLKQYSPFVVATLWIMLGGLALAIGRFIIPDSCYGYESGAYWLWTNAQIPACLASTLPIPLGIWLIIRMHRYQQSKLAIALFAIMMLGANILGCRGLGYTLWVTPDHVASVRQGGHMYNLATCTDDPDVTGYLLFECDSKGSICHRIESGHCQYGLPCEFELIANPENSTVSVIVRGKVDTIYSTK